MHIFYLHQYFATRKGKTGTRSYEFSRYLVGRGHRVTMITSGLNNSEFPVPQGEDFIEREVEGIRVVSIAAAYNDPETGTDMNGLQRMLKFYQFARRAWLVGKMLGRPDIVFATHTPLTIGLAGKRLARYFSIPFVFEVRDMWPEALVNVGALKNPFVIWWLRRMADQIYAVADHIVALSPGMKAGIVRAGVPADKITMIPNCCDLDLFNPHVDGASTRQRMGLKSRFAAIYFGAMGFANGLEYVIDGARILKERGNDNIVIVLCGSGGYRARLEKTARDYQLNNVLFTGPVTKNEITQMVAGCDICLTIFRAAIEQTWSPNKIFDALAAGKPVLVNVSGWLRELVEQNGCGIYLDPSSPKMLADSLEELALAPDRCKSMGNNARDLAEREFSREKLSGIFENVLLKALENYNLVNSDCEAS